MLRTFKIAAIATVALMAPFGAMAQFENKIPAFDQNGLTILDQRENCVLTKWDGVGGECGGTASNMWRTIFFAFDSADLSEESKTKLDRLYGRLTDSSQGIISAKIVGYADEIGTNGYNQKLSEKRANAVNGYLKNLGYEASEVTEVRALGERSSAGKCPTTMSRKERIACLWEDRRVEVELEYLNRYRRILR